MLGAALLALLHLLVPIYWLGGDLGAFYSAGFLIDPRRTVPERLLALRILNNIDMAPRTALILALPTGLLLAHAKGWLALSHSELLATCIAGAAWAALAWAIHLRHAASSPLLRRTDLAIRWIVLVSLIIAGGLGLVHHLPLFIALKCLLLAAAIAMGLLIRRLLVPLFAPVIAMRQTGATTPEQDRAIAGVIARTRPAVLCIWAIILAASLLGLAKPL